MPLIGMSGSAVMVMPALDAIRTAIELGYEAVEVFGEFPQCVCGDITREQREEGRKLVERSGIALTVHSPFTSLNIAAFNPGIRAESLRQIIAAIDLCADMGGRSVTVHNGRYILSKKWLERTPEAFMIQWQYNVESLKRASERAEKRGVALCLENIGFEHDSIDRNVGDVLKVREDVGSPSLFFCLDIGHARLNNELPLAIQKMGPLTRTIHFTDNNGHKDDHLVIGEGNSDYSPNLDFFKNFEHIIILEVLNFGNNPAFAKESLRYTKELFA